MTDTVLGQSPKADATECTGNPMGLIMDVVQTTSVTTTSHQVTCGSCGRVFRPNSRGQKFCDHQCYSKSLIVSIADRFWTKVNKLTANGCWLWTASCNKDGYGQIASRASGKFTLRAAHRVAWELTHGPIPGKLEVLHKCDVPPCVNPDHLFLGTQQENLADAREKGRLNESLPRRGKLTYEDKLAIMNAPEQRGVRVRLARQYGVSKTAIHHIRAGRFAKPRDLRPVTHRQAS